MPKQSSFTFDLSTEQQDLLLDVLKSGSYFPFQAEHTIIAVTGNECRISLYKSGKCLVQGKGAEDFVTFVLEPLVLKEARLGYEQILEPETYQPHMGVDESGKGDFFGPLVVASVYVDPELTSAMRDMGVKESKRISSDKRALALARSLRELLRDRYSIVTVGPLRYNALYTKMRNVNRLLAWAHARAIENLLKTVPSCPRAISDQFGQKRQVESALMKNGRKIELVQRHRAESDPAVAAASVLARGAFIYGLGKLREQYGISLPKGASAGVGEAAVELVRKHGPQALLGTAKCHFKTTDKVLTKLGSDRSVLGPDGAATSKPGR